MSAADPLLDVSDLHAGYGSLQAVAGISLQVGAAETVALIGRNGAGKTTLLKCAAGLIDPDEGKRTIVPGTNVVLLEQDPAMDGFATLHDWVLHGRDAPEGLSPLPVRPATAVLLDTLTARALLSDSPSCATALFVRRSSRGTSRSQALPPSLRSAPRAQPSAHRSAAGRARSGTRDTADISGASASSDR